MRLGLAALLCCGAISCSDSSNGGDMAEMDLAAHVADLAVPPTPADMVHLGGGGGDGGNEPTLLVLNTIEWCTVIVTVGNGTPTTFMSGSDTFTAPAGTIISLQADPIAMFKPVKWTGVTTMNGDMATYVMTTDLMQSVTACCAEPDGSGC
jgi:hypothetical protein